MKQKSTEEIDRRQASLAERLSRRSRSRCRGRMLAGCNETFEMGSRVHATNFGGIGLVHRMVRQLGLPKLIDDTVSIFKGPGPYSESDHVLNIAYNVVCGGRTLDDLEYRRQDAAYMDALGATRLPDPTTAGDFLRRFKREDIDDLAEAINAARTRVWAQQDSSFFKRAIIDVDGTIAGTHGECKEGMDMSYKGIWGYAPLLVTLANTGEVLYTRNRSGNRPSHDGCFEYLDPAVEVAREAGFKKVRLRGDGHFALTEDFDHWTESEVEFVFGLAGHEKLVGLAEGTEEAEWRSLRRKRTTSPKGPRKRRVKQEIVRERGYRNMELAGEEYAELEYRPSKCKRPYRVVMLRKTIKISEGQDLLIPEVRFRFYITNVKRSVLSARQVIQESNDRCNQENLIEQTKNGVHAMRMPCDTLLANDAYMVMTCLAWNLKAWVGLLWPDAKQGVELRKMEFRRFVGTVIAIPCQVVETGRGVVHRLLAVTPWVRQMLEAHKRFKRLRLA